MWACAFTDVSTSPHCGVLSLLFMCTVCVQCLDVARPAALERARKSNGTARVGLSPRQDGSGVLVGETNVHRKEDFLIVPFMDILGFGHPVIDILTEVLVVLEVSTT